MSGLSSEAEQILRTKTFAHLAIVRRDGSPHVSPIWVDVDERGLIVVNTAEGRIKARLLEPGVRVGISALDPHDPYRYVLVRGLVVERTHDGAVATIHALSQKYRGADFDLPAGQQRVTIRIQAESDFVV